MEQDQKRIGFMLFQEIDIRKKIKINIWTFFNLIFLKSDICSFVHINSLLRIINKP